MLEKRFAKVLNRSAADVRRWGVILRIQQLLIDTDLTLAEIARIHGLVNSENMNVMFKTNVGVSAGTYRLKHRRSGVHKPSGDIPKASRVTTVKNQKNIHADANCTVSPL